MKDIIADGLAENIGMDAIADNIRDAYAFSEDRAELIARTEVAMANQTGAPSCLALALSLSLETCEQQCLLSRSSSREPLKLETFPV